MALVFMASIFIGFSTLNPATPNTSDQTTFNVQNAYDHIAQIAKEPHSIFDQEALGKVRAYLVNELEALGAQPEIYAYEDIYVERTDTYEPVKNIYGKIDGKNDSYIMLVTHYDSSHAKKERYAEIDGSLGAADAGYGLSTILETLRVIVENDIQLENGIKILITDGEEYGLLGAKEAVKEAEIFENVNYLINLEARGVKGPAVMFETSFDNQSVLDLYNATNRAFSYSINPEIYRLLPNGTDFSVFLENGIKGINISVLDSLDYYHTPKDSLESVSLESLQHYGDQVLPIVTEFVTNSAYESPEVLEGDGDSIFFTLTKDIFIKYSHTMNYIFLVLILIGIIGFVRMNHTKVKRIVKYVGLNFIMGIAFAGVAYGISRVVAMIMDKPFKLTYLPLVPYEEVILISILVVSFVIYYGTMYYVSKKHKETDAYLVGSMSMLWLLSVVLTMVLPGGSYLTVFPLAVTLIGLLISRALSSLYSKGWAYVMLIPFALIVILFVPTIYLFNCALTFGGVAANMVFVWIGYMALTSCIIEIQK